ncbi:MAG TPA: hypothetical protein VGZ25_10865, partial [Gemmataceae bacterium]|nr:hypothetical protein [Gemmataceae bacterium]
ALQPAQLKSLRDNLVSEGQMEPLSAYDSGKTDERGRKIYTLSGGFRRYYSLQDACRQNLDAARIHDDMDLHVLEIVQGAGQTDEEFYADVLVRSVGENEQRKNFTTEEKLRIVKLFQEWRIPDPRAYSALGISDTQYDRFVAVTSHGWLHDYVVQNSIGMSDAAKLIMIAEKSSWVEEFKEDFDHWVGDHRAMIEAERQELAKVGKKLSGSSEHVKKFTDPKLVDHWSNLIKGRQRFGGKPQFQFGIHIDLTRRTITVPGRTFKSDELAADDYETMIAELQDAMDELVPLMQQRRVMEQATGLSDEEKQKELDRITKVRKQKKRQQAKANEGRPAPDFGKSDSPSASEIDVEDEQPGEDLAQE